MKETNLEKAVDALKTIVDETLGEGKPVAAEDTNKRKKCAGESDKELDKVKLYFWIVVLLLIAAQIIALRWWAILTGIITFIIAMFVDDLISNREEIKEQIQEWMDENKGDLLVYVIAIIAILVEAFTIGWWTILAGPATLLVAFLLNKLIKAIAEHFYY